MSERTFLLPASPRPRGRRLLAALLLALAALVSVVVVERMERITPNRSCSEFGCRIVN